MSEFDRAHDARAFDPRAIDPRSIDLRAVAARALPLLDLTDLDDACTPERVDALCQDARTGGVAAVCVWPRFVARAAAALGGTVPVATVIDFPRGGEDPGTAAAETAEALRAGAGEIDLVLPHRALLRGDADVARAVVAAVRAACPGAPLKVILETGALPGPEAVRAAGRLAIEGGADFLKTSTGKTPVSATPEAAEAMLSEIAAAGRPADRTAGRPCGLKVSGGVRTVAQAAAYLALADRAMGPGWATPRTFRFGASALYGALMREL